MRKGICCFQKEWLVVREIDEPFQGALQGFCIMLHDISLAAFYLCIRIILIRVCVGPVADILITGEIVGIGQGSQVGLHL